MKALKYLLFSFLLLPLITFADEEERILKGNMNITYKYGETLISDSTIKIYEVAIFNNDNVLTYTENFKIADDIELKGTKELIELTTIIDNYVLENNVLPIKVCTTNKDGLCELKDLYKGLYLIKPVSKTELGKQYYASPSLVTIPLEDEVTKELKYDIDVILKTEVKDVECPECNIKYNITTRVVNGTIDDSVVVNNEEDVTIHYSPKEGYKLTSIIIDGNSINIKDYPNSYTFKKVTDNHDIIVTYEKIEDVPKTLDDIFTYVFLLGGSIIILGVVTYYIIKMKKKDNGKEE